MLEKLFHLLTGYARFEVLGEPARFFNLAARSGFGLWGFSRENGRAGACCRAREYRKLKPLAGRCRIRLRCVKKGGLPFQTGRLWKRKGLVFGLLCGIGIYWCLSGFVWGVSVSGTERLSDKIVLEAAGESGVFVGARQSGFVPKLASHSINSKLPQLKWVSVNTDGCFAEIAVGEAAEAPGVADDEAWSNIVASREGVVKILEAERGRPEVELGDTVAKGDLLISGLYRERLDPYGPAPKDPFEAFGAARGRVVAETYREFTVQVSARKRERVPVGKEQVNRTLNVFGLQIPLGFNDVPDEKCQKYTKVSAVTALDTVLPLSVEREFYAFLEEKERVLDREEMEEAALLKLRDLQKSELPEGGKVVREELEYAFPDGMCILTARCRCEEEIGIVQEILVNETNFEENF